ncbi:MAG: peptidylprolyl isomerase [Thiohalospira sp.]
MRKIPGLLIILIFCFFAFAKAQKNEVLLSIDDETVTKDEFLRFYQKNKINLTTGETIAVDKYLELFINFKLKVIEAKNQGLDTTQEFINEFEGYKKQLAKPYLLDRDKLDELVEEAYHRMQYEVKASHILVRVKPDASPEDTAYAYKKAVKIRNRILRGEPFHIVAKGASDDPSVKNNAGDLGYFTVFQMVYPFEKTVYNMNVGEIAGPVKTRFGYHIIKLTDKKEARGQIKTAHIMLASPEKNDSEKKELINKLYHRLRQGEDFAKLAREYSDDKGSAKNGGELPWFGVGQMVQEFENAAFDLKSNGDISKPVKTNYGWHIIKRIDRKEPKSFEKIKDDLRRQVINDGRYLVAQESLIEKLKDEYNFKEKKVNLPVFFDTTENSFVYNDLYFELKNNTNDTLFSFANKKVSVKEFERFIQHKKGRQNITPFQYNKLYEDYVDQEILQYEESRLEQKHPEYKFLLKEYYDGMLLFEIMDQEVWSKAINDTLGLKKYYNNNKENYMWDERWKGSIYYCKNKEVYQKVKKEINKRRFGRRVTNNDLLQEYNLETEVLKIETGIFNQGENNIIDEMVWEKSTNENENLMILIKGEKVKPTIKPFNEAKGLVISDYQEYLEEKWVEKLRSKYNIQVNNQVLSSIQ